jgi:hypothetical protein
MTLTKLLGLWRREVDDLAEPQFWSDEDFFIYLNDAQDVFVRETGGLADRRSSLTRMTYKIGDQFKKYHPRILRINGAKDADQKFIGIRNFDNIQGAIITDDYGHRGINNFDDTLTGPLQFIITDVDADDIQLYPIPDADGSLQLFIQRLPLREIEDEDSILEIKEQHHLELLYWVKYKCYSNQDSEIFDGKKAAEYRSAFDACVVKAKKAIAARVDRKRTVRYAGI